jgi:LysM repeat protein
MLYVVQPGDSLGRIAAAHGTTVAAIVMANGFRYPDLGSGVLRVDMRLQVPTGRVHRGGP